MKRKIPLKNYIILLLITFLTIGLLFYLTNIYNTKKKYNDSINVRMSFLRVMHEKDFRSFITENQEFVLYISNSDNEKNKNLETNLKKQIIKKGYDKEIIYLNSKEISNNFIEKNEKYLSKKLKTIDKKILPGVLIIKGGKITNVFYIYDNNTYLDIIKYIELNFYGVK